MEILTGRESVYKAAREFRDHCLAWGIGAQRRSRERGGVENECRANANGNGAGRRPDLRPFAGQCASTEGRHYQRSKQYVSPLKNFTVAAPNMCLGIKIQTANDKNQGMVSFFSDIGQLNRIDYVRLRRSTRRVGLGMGKQYPPQRLRQCLAAIGPL